MCPEGVLERLFRESGGNLGASRILWWSFWGLHVDFGKPWVHSEAFGMPLEVFWDALGVP